MRKQTNKIIFIDFKQGSATAIGAPYRHYFFNIFLCWEQGWGILVPLSTFHPNPTAGLELSTFKVPVYHCNFKCVPLNPHGVLETGLK